MPKIVQAYPPIADSIKRLAKGVFDASQPTDLVFGIVESANPLKIRINQKMVLPDEFLILTNAVKDHSVDVTVSWSTVSDDYLKTESTLYQHTHKGQNYVGNMGKPLDGESDPTDIMKYNTTHHHDIKGRKKITIHNGLTVGEKVLLLRTQGGQNYVVIDRVDEIPTTGEWL